MENSIFVRKCLTWCRSLRKTVNSGRNGIFFFILNHIKNLNIMKRINYYKGQKLNNLTFIEELPKRNGRRYAKFMCYCGNEFVTEIGSIRRGNTTSCGCYQIKQLTTHGLTSHPLYKVWVGMKGRCLNRNDKAYNNYGDRGITICKKWTEDFLEFYNWSIKNGYLRNLTVERINNDNGYFPENCTFITNGEQAYNRRSTILTWKKVNEIREIKKNNPQILQREIADIYGVNKKTIWKILSNNSWKV